MTEQFTSIKTEVYVSSAWLDISADVLVNPRPKVSGIGIMGNSILDRVGEPGTYTFSLNNSTTSIGGVLGYYTPQSPSRLTGWQTGIPVRLSFVYDGYNYIKFYGTIDRDGIEVITGKKGERRVNVRASNFMARAAAHKLSALGYQTTARADQGLQAVIDNMSVKPLTYQLTQGAQSFPTLFDVTRSDTMALGEIQKLIMSGLDYAFVNGNDINGETFRYMTRTDWLNKISVTTYPAKNSDFSDALLDEGGVNEIGNEDGTTSILLEHAYTADWTTSAADHDNMVELKVLYGKNIANHVKMITYPRTVDTSNQVLWSLSTPITIAAGETLTDIRGRYTDPANGQSEISGVSMVTPVITTDYLMNAAIDGSGVDRSADLVVSANYNGTAEVIYTLTNNNAATSYITKLQARGLGVYVYDTSEKMYDSTTSQTTYGVVPLDIDMPYLDGVDNLFVYADKGATNAFNGGILTQLDVSMLTVERVSFIVNRDSKLMLGFMFLEPSDAIKLYETITDDTVAGTYDYWTNASWWIMGYDFEIIDGKYVKWSLVLKFRGLT